MRNSGQFRTGRCDVSTSAPRRASAGRPAVPDFGPVHVELDVVDAAVGLADAAVNDDSVGVALPEPDKADVKTAIDRIGDIVWNAPGQGS